jgi:hypothetical protein
VDLSSTSVILVTKYFVREVSIPNNGTLSTASYTSKYGVLQISISETLSLYITALLFLSSRR